MIAKRRPLIAANWKMHKKVRESVLFAQKLSAVTNFDSEAVLIPVFTAIDAVRKVLDGTSIQIGAQDLSAHDQGAHTGDVSGDMLSDLGCKYVLVGHSERRRDHHEIDEIVRQKLMAALRHQLIPIFCLGETLQEREDGHTLSRVRAQLEAVLSIYDANSFPEIVIAYEPIWAIGTGKTASPDDAQQVHAQIRSFLATLSSDIAERTRLIYGGSVKPDSAQALLKQSDIDGLLVGGASLEIDSFLSIIHANEVS